MSKTTMLITLFLVICAADARAQWVAQASGTTVRLRGVSAVNRQVAWASGANGTYARTTDGGRSWQTGQVHGAADLDFRDVDAFDADTAYLLAIGPGERSRIYKTTDGGRTWRALGDEGFHAVSISPRAEAAWAVGEDGRVARLDSLARLWTTAPLF